MEKKADDREKRGTRGEKNIDRPDAAAAGTLRYVYIGDVQVERGG